MTGTYEGLTAADVIEVHVDGGAPAPTAVVAGACAHVEQARRPLAVVLRVYGAPSAWPAGLTTTAVGKWEQALRRLERLPALTVAVASGDCGGPALDALLATDHRIATPDLRLLTSAPAGIAWPGMALFRLAGQGTNADAVRHAVLLGLPITAAEAADLRLVHEVTGDPTAAVTAAVRRAGAVPGDELAVRRQLMLDARSTSFEEALGAHLAACDRELRRTTPERRT